MKQKIQKPFLRLAWLTCLLCLGFVANATVTITGTTPVCKGNTGTYSLSPASGKHYVWSTSYHGTITGSSTGTGLTVVWGIAGSATVKVYEYNGSNVKTDSGTLAVTVEPLPTPTISASVRVACQQLTDTSKPVSETDTRDNPGVLDDKNGCIKVCEYSTVVYTANGGSGSAYSWSVTGATSYSSSGNTCTVIWGPKGAGSITVTETSSPTHCQGSKTICIDIIEKPHAHFFAQPDSTLTTISICLHDSVIFVENSTGTAGSPIVSWYWDFGNGQTFAASSPGPVQTGYNTPGVFKPFLVVKNACGCVDTFFMIVNVSSIPGPRIVCPSVVCDSGVANYSVQNAMPCPSAYWSALGGTVIGPNNLPSVDIQWDNVDTTGFGYVVYHPGNCRGMCTSPTVAKVPVIQAHGHISGPLIVCPNSSYLYSMPQWPTTTWSWDVISSQGATLTTNGQRNQIVLNTHGGETLTLRVKYHNTLLGCGGSAQITINVLDPDSIAGPKIVCLNSNSNTWTLANGGIGDWTLTGPGGISDAASGTNSYTPSTGTFSAVGTYTISVSGTTFCPPAPIIVTVNPLPPAPDSLIGPDSVCFGSATLYKAKFPLPGTIFEWSVAPGGGTVNAANGQQTYLTASGTSPNVLSVVRITRDEAHCRSSALTKNVYRAVPTVSITPLADTFCPSTVYTFKSNYSKGETYKWYLTNITLANVQGNANLDTANVLFNTTSGWDTLKLEVRRCDSTYTYMKRVFIRAVPTLADTIPTQVCRGELFTVSATGYPGATYDWDWGDGSPHGSGRVATHRYTSATATSFNYTVYLKVNTPFFCPGFVAATQIINVLPAPVASVSPPGPFHMCGATPSQLLTVLLQSGYEPTDSLEWVSVGTGIVSACHSPGQPLPPPCPTYTASAIGTYYAVAIGVNGCKDTSNYVVFDTSCGGGTTTTPSGAPCGITPLPTVSLTCTLDKCGEIDLTASPTPSSLNYLNDWAYPSVAYGVVSTIAPPTPTLNTHYHLAGNYSFMITSYFTNGTDTCIASMALDTMMALVPDLGHTIVCNQSGGYDVTIYDHSNYVPGHQPYAFTFVMPSGSHHLAGTPSSPATPHYMETVTSTTPFTYHVIATFINADGNVDSCDVSETFAVPAHPHAAFTVAKNPICTQLALQTTNTSTGSSPSYLWSWNTYSNTTTNPFIDVTTLGPNQRVYLQVSDQYGCVDTTSMFINVVNANLRGSLSGSGNNLCSGQAVALTYTSNALPFIAPDSFAWMNDLSPMFVTLNPVNTINVYDPGSYWVHVSNTVGCYFDTKPRNEINFVQTAPAEITGDSVACLNSPYTLYCYAGSDPTITYQWFKNGSAISGATSDTYTDPATTAGTFVYTLVVGTTLGTTTCFDTSAPFTVIVNSLPAPPTISFSMLDCSTYTLQLTASSSVSGATYTWSNGASGNPVSQTGGGPVRVWLTDLNGCRSHADTMIPKDPRTFLWIFPTGCYTICDDDAPRTLVGPAYHFYRWDWLESGTSQLSGIGSFVSDYNVNVSGNYQLKLDNYLCAATSDTMEVTVTHCEGCQQLQASISAMSVSCGPGCCMYVLTVNWINAYTSGVGVTIGTNAADGSIAPGGALIPIGPSTSTLQFIPAAGFGGGMVTITITYTDPSGQPHTCHYNVDITGCPPETYRMAHNSSTTTSDGIMLRLVPNPADNSTRIEYKLHNDQSAGTIEVTDITGRLVERHNLDATIGNWQVATADYKPGLYVITLREGGKVIQQTKLSVIH